MSTKTNDVKKKRTFRLLKGSILTKLFKTPKEENGIIRAVQKTTQQAKVFKVGPDMGGKFYPGQLLLIDPHKGIRLDEYHLFFEGDILAEIER